MRDYIISLNPKWTTLSHIIPEKVEMWLIENIFYLSLSEHKYIVLSVELVHNSSVIHLNWSLLTRLFFSVQLSGWMELCWETQQASSQIGLTAGLHIAASAESSDYVEWVSLPFSICVLLEMYSFGFMSTKQVTRAKSRQDHKKNKGLPVRFLSKGACHP